MWFCIFPPNLHAIFNFHETNLTFPKNCTMRSKNRCKHWDEARKGKTFYYLLCICDGLWSSFLIYCKIFNFIPVSIIYASKKQRKLSSSSTFTLNYQNLLVSNDSLFTFSPLFEIVFNTTFYKCKYKRVHKSKSCILWCL